MFQIRSSFLLLYFIIFSYAHAAYFEPYVGQARFELKQMMTDTQDPSLQERKINGQRFGGGFRFGPSFRPFFAGIDTSYYPLKRLDSFSESKTLETLLMFGPSVGMELPLVPIHVWFSYCYVDRFRLVNAQTLSGTGYKFGMGVHVLPKISLNIEFARHDFRRLEHNSSSDRLPYSDGRFGYDPASMSTLFLSLGIPLW